MAECVQLSKITGIESSFSNATSISESSPLRFSLVGDKVLFLRYGISSLMDRLRQLLRLEKRDYGDEKRAVFLPGYKFASSAELENRPKYCTNEIKTSKYTIWNFLPLNLFEQLRRVANFYFLCVAVIQLTIDSPVSPATSLLPLLFVLGVTAAKQGWEDFLRHRGDNAVNNKKLKIVKDGEVKVVKSKSVLVGDILRVEDGDEFPCDLVIVSCSDAEGRCSVTTANLDGETNLKIFTATKLTRDLRDPRQLTRLNAKVECEQPTAHLYKYQGKLEVVSEDGIQTAALGPENLLLRGARLRETEYAYGVAVYTGIETKMSMNSKMTRNKFSTVEKTMNWFLVFFIGLLIFEIGLCTALKYSFMADPTLGTAWYLGPVLTVSGSLVYQDMASFLVIFNYIIPISLYVTIELQKLVGTWFFEWDQDLHCKESGEKPICNSSDLNEELGQVEYLFSDKTGTLTENMMLFKEFVCDGQNYEEEEGVLYRGDPRAIVTDLPKSGYEFLVAMALCHTVRAVRSKSGNKASPPELTSLSSSTTLSTTLSHPNGFENEAYVSDPKDMALQAKDMEYQAASPDEKALVEACKRLGVIFLGEDNDDYVISLKEEIVKYKKLHVLDFDSDRKCMSVIFSCPDGTYTVITKGAESSMFPRCDIGPKNDVIHQVNVYAQKGLRTLVYGTRDLSTEEYQNLSNVLKKASESLEDREAQLQKVYAEIESDLRLLGATAVEDKLQDGVTETLEALREAGLKVWILTGDKVETAENISQSCGHIKPPMQKQRLVGLTEKEECYQSLVKVRKKIFENPGHTWALIIDGATVAVVLEHHREIFQEIAEHTTSVVCCRMSPIQKAEVVKLAKGFKGSPITAAVGDGANDVSMIQEAHVGLGIMGKEGRQAVRCSDFAFGRFRFIKKVLLVHGQWYYWRVSVLVNYFFYKNVAFILPCLFFQFFSAYSTEALYTSWYLTLYNITYTSLPIFIYALFEQNYPADRLMTNYQLYKDISRNRNLTWKVFFGWNLLGLWHAVVLYFGVYLLYSGEVSHQPDGKMWDGRTFGTLVFHCCIFVVLLKLIVESRYLNFLLILSVVLSIVFFIGTSFGISSIFILEETPKDMYWIYHNMIANINSWAFLFLAIFAGLLPDFLLMMWRNYRTDGVHIPKSQNPRYQLEIMLRGSDQKRISNDLQSTVSTSVVSERLV